MRAAFTSPILPSSEVLKILPTIRREMLVTNMVFKAVVQVSE